MKCTHGATIGQIDETALFYLRSRGVPESEARAMLLFAFANESLDRMRSEVVRGVGCGKSAPEAARQGLARA